MLWPSIANVVRAKHRHQQEPSLYSSAAPKGDCKPNCSHMNMLLRDPASATSALLNFKSSASRRPHFDRGSPKKKFLPCASLASTRPPGMNFPRHRYHSQRKIFLILFHASIHGTNMRPCIIRSLLRTSVCATSLSFPRSSRVRLGIEWIENLTTFQPSNATL